MVNEVPREEVSFGDAKIYSLIFKCVTFMPGKNSYFVHKDDSDDIQEEPKDSITQLKSLLEELGQAAKSSSRTAPPPKTAPPRTATRGKVYDDEGRISLEPIPLKQTDSLYSIDDPRMQSAYNDRQIPDAYMVQRL